MTLIVIHAINHQEKTNKDGNPYTRCGIKYRGKWYSGFGDEVTKTWRAGNTVDIDFWEEEGKPDENGDVKVFGNFVRIFPVGPQGATPLSTKPAKPIQTGEVDASTIPDLQPEIEDLPF